MDGRMIEIAEALPRNRRLTRAKAVALVALVGITAAACFSDDNGMDPNDGEPVAAVVNMTDALKFDQGTDTIQVGEKVRWENVSSVAHTVTTDPDLAQFNDTPVSAPAGEEFDSDFISPGRSFTRTFTVAGEYNYFCRPHEGSQMFGTLVVEE